MRKKPARSPPCGPRRTVSNPFELALRRAVADEPRVRLLSPAVAVGLVLEATTPVRVTGVRLGDDVPLDADVVLDCGGRRSPVAKWLAASSVVIPTTIEDCQVTYYERYFRQATTSDLDLTSLFVRRDLGFCFYVGAPGDHGTYSIGFAVPPWDHELKVLRHEWAWKLLAASIPTVARLVDPAAGRPIQDVKVMAGLDNVRRHFVIDGQPLVAGLLVVGDALCTTNPIYGWGATMALTYAFRAADAVLAHGDDPEAVVLAYDAAVAAEADGVFQASAASDRVRSARYRGEPVDPGDAWTAEEEDLIDRGVVPGVRRDPDMLRAWLRRLGLLDPPDALLAGPAMLAKVRAEHDRIAAKPPAWAGPTRSEFLELVAAAHPAGPTPPDTSP